MLCLTIRHGDGFTIGDDIVVKVQESERNSKTAVRVLIVAPRTLGIARVDQATVQQLLEKARDHER